MNRPKKIRVAVVDDSLFMRKLIKNILENDPFVEVIAEAENGERAIEVINSQKPDVVTMDYNMPIMDGETATRKIIAECPDPPAIIMLSASTKKGADITLRCLRAGAVDFLAKPTAEVSYDIYQVKKDLITKVRIAAQAKIKIFNEISGKIDSASLGETKTGGHDFVVIGASTGGPPVVENILNMLPRRLGSTVFVVQHMPEEFTKNFAERINRNSAYRVKEAEDNEIVTPGTCYLAKGGWHMKVKKIGDSSEDAVIYLTKEPKYNGFRPSIDVTMKSVVSAYGKKTIGVILTGMGSDGLEGMRAVKEVGGYTIAQSPDTCVISSMPNAIIDAGLADDISTIEEIAKKIDNLTNNDSGN